MKVKVNAYGLITARWFGMELDIPSEIVNKGEEAVTQWCNDNIKHVEYAPIESQETSVITKIFSVEGL